MPRFFSSIIWAMFCMLLTACTQGADNPFERVSISSSPNPVGSGARAAGMGNAFVAVADDATAASWNPAGLVQLLRPEVSVVGLYAAQTETRHAGTDPTFGGENHWDQTSLNFASLVIPISLNDRNVVFSLSRQELYRFDRSMSFSLTKHADSGLSGPVISQSVDVTHEQDFMQEGSLSALSLSCAAEVTPRLSVGFSLNIWNDDLVGDNSWTKHEQADAYAHLRTETISGIFEQTFATRQEITDTRTLEKGISAHMGLLWRPSESWMFGLCIKTPLEADLVRRSKTSTRDLTEDTAPMTVSTRASEQMDFPGSIAVGASYRHSDFFSISADVTRVDWDLFRLHTAGTEVSPITGDNANEADIPVTYAVRMGAEWLRPIGGTIVPLRCGVFYDPEPTADGVRDAWGVSCGAGILLHDRASIDIAYTYRWAEETPLTSVDGAGLEDAQHQIMLSTIFYF